MHHEWKVDTIVATGAYAVDATNDPMMKVAPYLEKAENEGWEVFSVFARYNDITVVCRRHKAT